MVKNPLNYCWIHDEHGSVPMPRQFHSPQFASVYSAGNEYMYEHCWESSNAR